MPKTNRKRKFIELSYFWPFWKILNSEEVRASWKWCTLSSKSMLLVSAVFGNFSSKVEVVSSRVPRREIGSKKCLRGDGPNQSNMQVGLSDINPSEGVFFCHCRLELTTSTSEDFLSKSPDIATTGFSYNDWNIGVKFRSALTFSLFNIFINGQKYDNSMNFLLRLVLGIPCYNEM